MNICHAAIAMWRNYDNTDIKHVKYAATIITKHIYVDSYIAHKNDYTKLVPILYIYVYIRMYVWSHCDSFHNTNYVQLSILY